MLWIGDMFKDIHEQMMMYSESPQLLNIQARVAFPAVAPHVPAAIFVLELFCIGHLGNISLLLIEKHHLELFFIGEWQRSLSSSL